MQERSFMHLTRDQACCPYSEAYSPHNDQGRQEEKETGHMKAAASAENATAFLTNDRKGFAFQFRRRFRMG